MLTIVMGVLLLLALVMLVFPNAMVWLLIRYQLLLYTYLPAIHFFKLTSREAAEKPLFSAKQFRLIGAVLFLVVIGLLFMSLR